MIIVCLYQEPPVTKKKKIVIWNIKDQEAGSVGLILFLFMENQWASIISRLSVK